MLEREDYYSEHLGSKKQRKHKRDEGEKRWEEGLEDKLYFRVLPSTGNCYLCSVCGGQVPEVMIFSSHKDPAFPQNLARGQQQETNKERQASVSHWSPTRLWTSGEEGETISLWGERPPSWQSVIDVETRWPSHPNTREASTVWHQSFPFKIQLDVKFK